jgi:uridine kinase
MVLSNREAEKVFWIAISMGDLLKIYILPLVYLLLVYSTWRLRRISFELLLATLGVAFSVLILLTPAPPGWFLWLTPILALHYGRGNGNAVLLGSLFSLAFVMYHSIYSTGAKIAFFDNLSLSMNIINLSDMPYIQSLLNTAIIGLVMVITLQIFRDGIKGSDYYHLGKKPLVIGISGADNSGKLNFVEALTGLFGKNKVLTISGENYFNWDKYSPMWQTITSSNPRASNIFLMISDLRKIISGEWIKRRGYNRDTGLFSTEKIHRGHQVIIVSGLHALHTKQLVEIHDVKFFLANKDDNQKSVNNVDFEKYIQPQQKSADIIFEVQTKSNKNIDLTIKIRDGVYYQELFRVLIGICGLQMEVIELDEYGNVELIVQGEIQSSDIRLAANVITPHLSEFIDQESGFYGGTIGVMQLVALMEIDEVLKRRRAMV